MSERRSYIVTGASSGIGHALTRALLDEGHCVVATGRNEERLSALADATGVGERLTTAVADAGDWADTEKVVGLCADRYGQIDGVVANAGYTVPGDIRTADVTLWPAMVSVNVLGPAYLARAAADHLEASSGRVVIIGSVAGHKNSPGNLYGATKWAATGLAENLRMLFAPLGVGVSLVSPGVVDTDFYPAGTPEVSIRAEDLAETVRYVLGAPAEVDLSTVVIRPRRQLL